jgi:hypothetical protein
MGHILVDFDGTLAEYKGWGDGELGPPVPKMLERVKKWLADGKEVKVFTARVAWLYQIVSPFQREEAMRQRKIIQDWCEEHLGQRLEVTAIKDFSAIEIWDDRAIGVVMNKGQRIDGSSD